MDAIYLVEDINARLGNLNDTSDLDSVSPRISLDIQRIFSRYKILCY